MPESEELTRSNFGNIVTIMLYWPEFDFDFRLDFKRLLPHLAAIAANNEAALNRVLPPPWRELPATETLPVPQPDRAGQQPDKDPIAARKRQLLLCNAGEVQAWVRKRFAPGSAAISMDDILAMHRMVAEESGVYTNNGGVLRTFPVQVGRREVGGLHAGAPAERLPRVMEQYVAFIHGSRLLSLPAVIHAQVAHFFFTTIHPFDDGNGRLCRLISAAILFQRGYNGHGCYAMSNYFYCNDVRYHTLLHRCWQKPLPFDLTEFVAFGMEGLVMELQGIRSFMKVKLSRSVERTILTPALRKKKLRAAGN